MVDSPINPYNERGLVLDYKNRFFGRARELREVFSNLKNMQSVSIVGERRIGKSSFLNRIAHPQSEELNGSFTLHYLDLQRVFSAEEFYERTCKMLKHEGHSHLDLEEAIQGKRVVFCLDEFEQAYKEDFGSEFFNALRSLAQTGNLALVVATQQPLDELHRIYLQDEDVTSKFHNIFDRLELGEFTPEEAREMVAATRNGHRFNENEIDFILKLAGNHPYRLNLACALVYDALREARAAKTEVDFVQVERKFSEEFAVKAPTDEQSSQRSFAASPLATVSPEPATNKSAAADVSLNPVILLAAALLFLIGAINIGAVSQRQNPISLWVAATCFFLTFVLMLAETVRFGRQAWRFWRSR